MKYTYPSVPWSVSRILTQLGGLSSGVISIPRICDSMIPLQNWLQVFGSAMCILNGNNNCSQKAKFNKSFCSDRNVLCGYWALTMWMVWHRKWSFNVISFKLFSSAAQSCPTLCNPMNCMQHATPPCPLPTPGACPNSCSLSPWCHSTISSTLVECSLGAFFSYSKS